MKILWTKGKQERNIQINIRYINQGFGKLRNQFIENRE